MTHEPLVQHRVDEHVTVTCLATRRVQNVVVPATVHHCRIGVLHVIHYCPCGIAWEDGSFDSDQHV
jgi:hypothetical protein